MPVTQPDHFFTFITFFSNVLIVHSKGLTKAKENYTLLIIGSVVFHHIPVNCLSSVNEKKKNIGDGCKDVNILKSREQGKCETAKNE